VERLVGAVPASRLSAIEKEKFLKQKIAALMLSLAMFGFVQPSRADDELRGKKIKHVLLISVDGLHALDVANYVAAHPNSALARLAGHGVTYSNARTPANSDSFPRQLRPYHLRSVQHLLFRRRGQHDGLR
jgi:hypothetical protein